jgi:hypothetical protein
MQTFCSLLPSYVLHLDLKRRDKKRREEKRREERSISP